MVSAVKNRYLPVHIATENISFKGAVRRGVSERSDHL